MFKYGGRNTRTSAFSIPLGRTLRPCTASCWPGKGTYKVYIVPFTTYPAVLRHAAVGCRTNRHIGITGAVLRLTRSSLDEKWTQRFISTPLFSQSGLAGARNRILIQESPGGEERTFSDLAKMAKVKELDSTAGHSTERLCGYALGPHLEGSRRRENSQGKVSGQRLSGPRSSHGQCGYCGVCKPPILSIESDVSGSPGEVAVGEPGKQERLPPGRWL